MGNFLDVDVDVDWLYKGKRKHKEPRKDVRKEVRKPRSSSVSNGSLSHSNISAASVGDTKVPAAAAVPVQPATTAAAAAAAPPPRQTQAQAQTQILPQTPARKSSGSVRTSVDGEAEGSGLRRSVSNGEKARKSLFGSLFRRNSNSAADKITPSLGLKGDKKDGGSEKPEKSAAMSIPKVRSRSASNSSGTQPLAAAMAHYLKEPSSPEVRDPPPIHEERVVLNRNTRRESTPIESLSKINLGRVRFAVDQFGMDPPQQIPSRKPRRGNVLVPEDMISSTPSISVGITNTQGSIEQASSQYSKDSRDYKIALDAHRRALQESNKHQQEAHYAAQRIATEVSNFKTKAGSGAPATASTSAAANAATAVPVIDEKMRNLEIDKPIHMHENHFQEDIDSHASSADDKLTLDRIYTRCCHLREILPIPSTLRQVKNRTAPLQTLKFLNPRPTLIDILSFCDFISIVPIHNIIFDNVYLSPEMFRIVMSSLVNSKFVEKVGLRNVTIDAAGWKLLCKFLLMNESIVKLDISQTKIKSDTREELLRSNMDWQLFINILQLRRGRPLEELLINGIKFESLDTFIHLLNAYAMAGVGNKKRLGLAQCDLNAQQLKFIFTWASDYKVQGVDLAFNDLSDFIKPLVGKLSTLSFPDLQYFTLNNTNIQSAYDAALVLRSLSKLPNLYFLDLSSLPQIFPDILPYLNKYLPRFANLKRLHIDNEDFSGRELAMMASILTKCKELLHVSILNLPKEALSTGACAGLYDFVRQSSKVTNLDVDYANIPDEISSRIALSLMRRMQHDFEFDEVASQDDLLFDGTLLAETAENMFEKFNNFEGIETDATRRYLLKRYWEKFTRVDHNVQNTIDQLFEKRSKGELNLQGKENLLRLLLLENSLSNILDVLKSHPQVAEMVGIETTAGQTLTDSDPMTASVDTENGAQVRPHLMATDSGRTIDLTTGRPILSKTSSHVSLVGKKQEEEEGEFHKWGFFVQQQRSIYPDNPPEKPAHIKEVTKTNDEQVFKSSSSSPGPTQQPPQALVGRVPTGAELKDAVMRAKGIKSIEELIQNVNHNRVTLDNIYGHPVHPMSSHSDESAQKASIISAAFKSSESGSDISSDEEKNEKVDETYDIVLNNLSRTRSNK
ncbi:LAMI_0H06018g1_1 [Lachancea mirantina]|uniref:LAMI_0H06018g1_1 n=1 Tax=Lachancea mirantina TaxID=1230905 RepID=A0A1G4KFP6_9SACH|nr:LAMI_0H06018g1_1 [Lachancea mirantina]